MDIERVDAIAQHAMTAPHAVALVDLETGREFTYQQMNERVGRVAGLLRHRFGVSKGDRVTVLSHNSSDVCEIQFACWRLGAIFVPINWRLTAPEIEFIVSDATPKVMIADTAFAASVEEVAARMPGLNIVMRGAKDSDYEQQIATAEHATETAHVLLHETASLIYTSGTTGRPKGARITHLMELFTCLNYVIATRVGRTSKTLVVLPQFHVGGLNCFPNPIFYLGGSVLVMKTFDPKHFLQLLGNPDHGITHVFAVPTIYALMSQEPEFSRTTFDHIVCAAVGGAAVPIALLQKLETQGLPIQQGWGMTESASMGSMLQANKTREKLGSAGLPVQHVRLRIADEAGRELPPDTVGELQVKGASVTPGYWNRPEANEKSYVDGWFRTGDAAYLDEEGYLYIVDRWTDMYISGGENVYPAEIENVLAGIPAVMEAAVIGIPNERWGQVGRAFIVLKEGAQLTEDEVRSYCLEQLAKYKIPQEFIFTNSIPHNAAGKVLKASLPRGPLGT